MRPLIYLDHNATTPPHEEVLSAMQDAWKSGWANPSSLHCAGRAARRLLEEAREAVATLAAQSPRDVVFTSGGTEANNLALERLFHGRSSGFLITSRLEHPSVLAFAEELHRRGIRVHWLEPLAGGHLSLESIEAALQMRESGEPTLIATHAVHHETGAIQPIPKLIMLARRYQVELHVDAVQAAGRVDPWLWRGASTVALASHKLRGPKGMGAVVAQPGILIKPILRGGSQERGLRPGTMDPITAVGFGAAARRVLDGGPERYALLRPLRDRLEQQAIAIAAEVGVQVECTGCEPRAPHVAHFLVDGWNGDELVAALDLEGICVSSGSACSAGTAEPSPAITAIVGKKRALSSLRVSLGETSTEHDTEAFLDAFRRVVVRGSSR